MLSWDMNILIQHAKVKYNETHAAPLSANLSLAVLPWSLSLGRKLVPI